MSLEKKCVFAFCPTTFLIFSIKVGPYMTCTAFIHTCTITFASDTWFLCPRRESQPCGPTCCTTKLVKKSCRSSSKQSCQVSYAYPASVYNTHTHFQMCHQDTKTLFFFPLAGPHVTERRKSDCSIAMPSLRLSLIQDMRCVPLPLSDARCLSQSVEFLPPVLLPSVTYCWLEKQTLRSMNSLLF